FWREPALLKKARVAETPRGRREMMLAPIRRGMKVAYIHRQWPVLLLVAAVLLPTACVLWLINDAVRNKRLVVRQQLADAYQSQVSLARERLDGEWSAKAAALDGAPGDAAAFSHIINSGM